MTLPLLRSCPTLPPPRRTDVIPQALLGDYQKLLGSAPTRRLNPSKVAECKFLHNRLVDVVNFMENIAVKDSLEKVSDDGSFIAESSLDENQLRGDSWKAPMKTVKRLHGENCGQGQH